MNGSVKKSALTAKPNNSLYNKCIFFCEAHSENDFSCKSVCICDTVSVAPVHSAIAIKPFYLLGLFIITFIQKRPLRASSLLQ